MILKNYIVKAVIPSNAWITDQRKLINALKKQFKALIISSFDSMTGLPRLRLVADYRNDILLFLANHY